MLATTIWLFFITQSFAKDLTPHAHQQVLNENVDSRTLVDYFDNINLPNPHYKMNYIYEQKRTDKASEIEQIEEEIGKYLHYQPTTTTTTEPQQHINDVNKNFKEITSLGPFETPIIVPETQDYKYEKKEVTPTLAPIPLAPALPATVLSPPNPQWEELKEVPNNDVAGFHLDRPQFPANVPTPHRHSNHQLHISPTTSEAPVQEEAHTNLVSTEKHIYLSPTTEVPSFKRRNGQHALAKVRPILDDIKQGSIGIAPRPVYRGSYKFSWENMNDVHTSNEPKVSQLKENPISSVPTLSPWYDGYGK